MAKRAKPKSAEKAPPAPDTDRARDPLSAVNCTCNSLRMATRAVTQFYDAKIAETGRTVSQFSMLVALDERGGMSMTSLAEAMVTDRTTLTRNLKPLEREGLVEIVPGEDRRARIVALTDKGLRELDAARPLWREAQVQLVEKLGVAEWDALLSRLQTTIGAIREN